MSQDTAIGWTDLSWNPVHGCSHVSDECTNCYAETLSLRYGQTAKPWTPENAKENVTLKPHKLREPLSGAKVWQGLGAAAEAAGKTDGKLVFVNSMSDLFHPLVPGAFIAEVFDVMEEASRHTFQILTKRPKRMRDWTRRYRPEPLENVWLGTSIGEREWVTRARLLGETPAAVRFVSAEPLLEPLIPDETHVVWDTDGSVTTTHHWPDGYTGPGLSFYNDAGELAFHWLIAGGESGSEHRPLDLGWVRDLRDTCVHEGVAFFFKQDSGARPGTNRVLDGRTWDEFPQRVAA